MKGIDRSCYYEGYANYKTNELGSKSHPQVYISVGMILHKI